MDMQSPCKLSTKGRTCSKLLGSEFLGIYKVWIFQNLLLDSYTKVSELSSYLCAFGIDCHCIALSLQARLPRPGSQRAVHSLEVSVLAPRHIVPTGVLSVAGTASARGWRAVTASAAETEVTLSPAWLCFGVPAGKHFLEPGNKKKIALGGMKSRAYV